MKRKLGINAHCLHGVTELDALPIIKEAGFETVFIAAYEMDAVRELKEKSDALGLELEFIHAPFDRINDMWLPGDDYLHIWNKMIKTIDSAAANGIPKVITHLSSGWKYPQIGDVGLARYDALVKYATEKGVTLAFENLRAVGNIAYFRDRYEDEAYVGFCYDCGHESCYTKTVRWMDIYTTKACCTHIHDNFSRAMEDKTSNPDIHLLPFDGVIDYQQMIRELDRYGYEGSLTLEVAQNRQEYLDMGQEGFLKSCYDRLLRISQL